ncbi:MAG: ATP-binding protein [Vampirovibrionales bacterium]|nr:ATP-binding protein [Vampirovibrionales bacterium]
MQKPLNVLIIEDSETDTLLLVRHISKGGYAPTYERVDTADGMQAALDRKPWDIVLSDHNMPGFNSFGALDILKQSGHDIPFIIISGLIGEEIAVEAMKAGAHDYLLKDKLTRLVPAIERELKKARQRHQLREMEEERLKLQEELRQAKDQAELANQRKSKVLAFVAHEFKNPLTAISTFSDLLYSGSAGPLNDKQKEFADHISTACQHLRDLLNDILDIAPIEAGTIQLDIQSVDLPTLLDEVRIIIEEPARRKKIDVIFNINGPIQTCQVDPKRLRQILINLLSNAIKYTSENDTVYLNVCLSDNPEMSEKSSDKQWLEFHIVDHGIGIPQAELDKLFQDYYRVRNTLSAQREGLGLGLALCKKLVELHDGEISVISQEQSGSTFTVKLPYEPNASVSTKAGPPTLMMAL